MMAEKEEKKKTIHDTSGITVQYSMQEIEKATHPRAREQITKDLEDLVGDFAEKHHDKKTGSIKDPEEAADVFLELLAKYHFGSAYDAVKDDPRQVAKFLEENYGITRRQLVRAFKVKGAYATRRALFEQHMDPIIEHVHNAKQQQAQQSMNAYLEDGDTRKEVEEHLEKRTGRKLSKDNYLTLQDAMAIVSTYMQLPGSEEFIENKDAGVKLPDTMAGRPGVHHAFEGGDKLYEKYQDVAKDVDGMHRLKGKKKTGTYDR